MRLPVQYLGQSGWKLQFPELTVYIDPYLSNSVQELDAPDLERLRPVPFPAESVHDADYVLITHEHMDHCDPQTLPLIAQASPQAKFIGPKPVINKLHQWGIDEVRLTIASEKWSALNSEQLRICAVPAAHLEIERDSGGNLAYVGFLIEFQNKKIYIAGDTCLTPEVIDTVVAHGPIHTAVLPVNEHNYYRAKRGIVGNMSVREAFQFASDIGAKNMVAVHWDMFQINSVFPEEIRLLHNLLNPSFSLYINPSHFNLGDVDVSVVIRTLNEAKHLDELLSAIKTQKTHGLSTEVVIVDSGSTDRTLDIAKAHGCHIEHIAKSDFSFGRSLNKGCRAADGDILVFTSGHCVPINEYWLQDLCQPILDGKAQYTYGRQHGGPQSYFSEHRIFAKYFPETSKIPQQGFFCNNANSAIHRDSWMMHLFDEELTGLEDMELAQRLVNSGGKVAYVAEAGVYHYHSESWAQVRRRFEREAIALQKIMPQLHVSKWDALRYIFSSVCKDWRTASKKTDARSGFKDILLYRWNQYIGCWRGNHEHRKLSREEKEKYFFPT
jgi:rhamnosyltransferase